MKPTRRANTLWFATASVFAISSLAPTALAQDNDDQRRTLGTVLVTTQKVEESIQDVPIAVSAFDEDALEKLQLAGGPDLVKSIPNVAFTKGNFTGFNFKIRGIGADLVAQSGDSGVGVHQNDVPLTASRLFEAEFFDVERVETLRGPQGTLYGRNATGGVINVITAKPVLEEFQANARVTYGNYNTIKAKGMVNLPIGETAALRLAGSYLSRDGFAENTVTGNEIDDRDLYGLRATLAWEPTDRLRTWISYEHFNEEDNRIRAGKQLCDKDPGFTSFMGVPVSPADQLATSLGCQEAPLSQSFDRVNSAATLGGGLAITAGLLDGDAFTAPLNRDLRQIESAFDPIYEASQDLITAKVEYDLTDTLMLTLLAAHNEASVLSIEDYNKIAPTISFNEEAGAFAAVPALYPLLFPGGVVDDPQLGTTNLFRTFDLSGDESEQDSFEVRLQSDFDGPFNFNLGAIYVDYEVVDPQVNTDGYYVFSNSLTALTQLNNAAAGAFFGGPVPIDEAGTLFDQSLAGNGGNYFRTVSPYRLESFALFGETYFDVSDTLTLTLGLRYTDDRKEQDEVNTFLFTPQAEGADPLEPTGLIEASFEEVTGRLGFDWQPDVSFSEDTLIYGFYSRGYKAGGINPPQPEGSLLFPVDFEPEFIDSFEIGAKNTLADGRLQLNATGFYYDYQGYQITQIVNRTSANFNIDAELQGLELEAIWNPVSTLVLSSNLGLLKSEIGDEYSLDVLNRANGRSDLVVLKNAVNFSNCAVSSRGYFAMLSAINAGAIDAGATRGICSGATADAVGGVETLETLLGLRDDSVGAVETVTYVDSNGDTQTASALAPIEGEAVNLSGNAIPNAPEVTFSFGAEYTWTSLFDGPWDLTARGDYYYQGESFSRVYNTGHDRLDSWDNINLSLVLANTDSDWTVELFGKNITDEEVITGTYLTDDSSGLFTNIFLSEPRTYGVTLSKRW